MPLLQFLPWCKLDRKYECDIIALLPFERGKPLDRTNGGVQEQIDEILSSYRELNGDSVSKAAIIQMNGRELLGEATEEEIEQVRDLVELVCFCGLARRELFNPAGSYCNTDSFTYYGQKFQDKPGCVGLFSRRREGRIVDGRLLKDTVITVPVHVSPVQRVALDSTLLDPLLKYRQENEEKWGTWQNAISCFNQANTDNEVYRHQTEWVLLASAFEQILCAKPDYEDVAVKFESAFVPRNPLSVKESTRSQEKFRSPDSSVRYEWMREFYRVRGDFAHGRLATRQPMAWSPSEHLVLAAIAFPLLVKAFLEKAGHYQKPKARELTAEELVYGDKSFGEYETQRDAFEALAAEGDFLNPPENQRNSMDSVWSRKQKEAGDEKMKAGIAELLSKEKAPESGESNPDEDAPASSSEGD